MALTNLQVMTPSSFEQFLSEPCRFVGLILPSQFSQGSVTPFGDSRVVGKCRFCGVQSTISTRRVLSDATKRHEFPSVLILR